MSFIISTQAEVLKIKRTASFWLSILGAVFVPGIFFLIFTFNPNDGALKDFTTEPWQKMFYLGWEFFCAFTLPMYIILISTLLPQIEVKNNTWKQVFASPQSIGNIFFSKFAAVHIMIISCFLLYNAFMILTGVIVNLMNPKFPFLHNSIHLTLLLWLSFKFYISILGITAIQFYLSLRFKNFVAPIGIGLALVIGAITALNLHWEYIDKYPYAFPIITSNLVKKEGRPFLENHEWYSIGYFVFFMLLGFLDMKMRKEKG
jgi:lantibiotic transport system permease protein